MKELLVAQYENYRQNALLGFVQHPQHFEPAFAFAMQHRLCPIFHRDAVLEVYGADPFEGIYAVSREFIVSVLKYVDSCWLEKNLGELEFYKLEEKFGGYKSNRAELIRSLEYFRIAGRFDESVYSSIESNAPVEANSLLAYFSPDEVYLT